MGHDPRKVRFKYRGLFKGGPPLKYSLLAFPLGWAVSFAELFISDPFWLVEDFDGEMGVYGILTFLALATGTIVGCVLWPVLFAFLWCLRAVNRTGSAP